MRENKGMEANTAVDFTVASNINEILYSLNTKKVCQEPLAHFLKIENLYFLIIWKAPIFALSITLLNFKFKVPSVTVTVLVRFKALFDPTSS